MNANTPERDDAQAFACSHASEKEALIKRLLADPQTTSFAPSIVAWLLKELESARYFNGRALTDIADLRNQLAAVNPVMPKSKAIVKQAKMIARLAECVAEVDRVIQQYTPGSDIEADLTNALRGWQRNYPDLIEAARDGD